MVDLEFERVRDFLILHYHATERTTPLWVHCREMPLPDSLVEKLELFRERGHVVRYKDGLFLEPSWLSVYLGQHVRPGRHDPYADRIDLGRLRMRMNDLRTGFAQAAETMPDHAAFLAGYCPSQ